MTLSVDRGLRANQFLHPHMFLLFQMQMYVAMSKTFIMRSAVDSLRRLMSMGLLLLVVTLFATRFVKIFFSSLQNEGGESSIAKEPQLQDNPAEKRTLKEIRQCAVPAFQRGYKDRSQELGLISPEALAETVSRGVANPSPFCLNSPLPLAKRSSVGSTVSHPAPPCL